MAVHSNAEMPLNLLWQVGECTCGLARPSVRPLLSRQHATCHLGCQGLSQLMQCRHIGTVHICQQDIMAGLRANLWVVQAQCALHLAHLGLDLLQPVTCAHALSLLLPAWHRGVPASSSCWHACQDCMAVQAGKRQQRRSTLIWARDGVHGRCKAEGLRGLSAGISARPGRLGSPSFGWAAL